VFGQLSENAQSKALLKLFAKGDEVAAGLAAMAPPTGAMNAPPGTVKRIRT